MLHGHATLWEPSCLGKRSPQASTYQYSLIFIFCCNCTFLLIFTARESASVVTAEIINPVIASSLAVSRGQSGPAYGQGLGKHLEVRRRQWSVGMLQEPDALWCHGSPGWVFLRKQQLSSCHTTRTMGWLPSACIFFHLYLNEWRRHKPIHVSGSWSQMLLQANEPG